MKTLHAVVAATMPKHLTLATARALLSIKPNLKMLITPTCWVRSYSVQYLGVLKCPARCKRTVTIWVAKR